MAILSKLFKKMRGMSTHFTDWIFRRYNTMPTISKKH